MKKLRIGILGSSKVALKNVIPTLLEISDLFEIVGVSGRDFKRTVQYSKINNLFPFKCHDDLLKESLDFVYISLPNALHYPWVIKALNLGINVVCEKSLGCNAKEVEEMTGLALKNNKFLFEHFQFRFHNQLEEIKKILVDIGEIKSIRTSFCIPPFDDSNNIRYSKDLGGGALLDNGVYIIQLARQILGDNLVVKFCSLKFNKNIDISGNIIVCDEEKNTTVFGTFGFDHIYKCDLEIIGSKGHLYTDRLFTAPKDLNINIYIELQEGYQKHKKTITLKSDNQLLNLWKFIYDNFNNDEIKKNEYKNCNLQAKLIDQAFLYASK
jgi:NDP-hexose-3-ketoreductase